MYTHSLLELGIQKEVNKVRFKVQLIGYFPQVQVQNEETHLVMVFDQVMRQMLREAFTDYEGDAVVLAKAAKILREIFFLSIMDLILMVVTLIHNSAQYPVHTSI